MMSRLTVPFKDIFTTIFTVETQEGVLIFDTGTYPEDITHRLLPFLAERNIRLDAVRAIFISHSHGDHAGGLATLAPLVPDARIYTRSKKLAEQFPAQSDQPEDGEVILGDLQVVTIPGQSKDSMGLLDLREETLLSGDCLQLYGIFGSGKWGSNITLPTLHFQALEKLASLPIRRIYAAHDYHPQGWCFEGEKAVAEAIENCRKPLYVIRDLIREHPDLSDEQLAELFRDGGNRPAIHNGVVTAVRKELADERL